MNAEDIGSDGTVRSQHLFKPFLIKHAGQILKYLVRLFETFHLQLKIGNISA